MNVVTPRLPERLLALDARLEVPPRRSCAVCEIELVADRVSSLVTGSTHKVYRDWRFEVVCATDGSLPCEPQFTAPINPVRWEASGSRFTMKIEPGQSDIDVGGSARFTWTTIPAGATNAFAAAHDQAQQWLDAAGVHPAVPSSPFHR